MRISFLFIGLITIFASCKKVYQCECNHILNGEDWNAITTNIAIKETKENAKSECASLDYSYGWQDYQTCKLK